MTALLENAQELLYGNLVWWLSLLPAVLAMVFLGLWLGARRRGGDRELSQRLRATENELRLLKGDAIQARRDHAVEVQKLTRELETLRAVADGRVPPELLEWQQRALEAEKLLVTQQERHRAEIEKVIAAVGAGGVDQTMIAPGGVRERIETLERELAEARHELEAAGGRYEADLATLADRLNAEKAAALTAQARRHEAEIEALRGRLAVEDAAKPHVAQAAMTGAERPGGSVDAPDSARFPFLEVLSSAGQGTRHFLPYDSATIGRAETCTVAIQEALASRTHAKIDFNGVDFILVDLNSTNGTLLNQELVANATLDFDDVIQIGETRLRFTCEACQATATDPAFAKNAFEGMLELAPNYRSALRGLSRVLEQDASRRNEVSAVVAKLAALEKCEGDFT
jgi:hypothetical protein